MFTIHLSAPTPNPPFKTKVFLKIYKLITHVSIQGSPLSQSPCGRGWAWGKHWETTLNQYLPPQGQAKASHPEAWDKARSLTTHGCQNFGRGQK